MSGVIISGSVCLLLIVMGVCLLNGRGAFLIAGYNTMPKNERARYDERALCSFVGKLLISVAACIAVTVAGGYFEITWLSVTGTALMFVLCFGAIIYANTGNRFIK